MNIVYAADDNFAEILGISMISLFENNKDCKEITVFVLDDGIKNDSKEKLNFVAKKYVRKIKFYSIPNLSELAGVEIKTNERWSLSTFSRLFLEKILPDEIDKVLYLDCDILVNNSLEKLYDTNLGEYYCGGVSDCISKQHKIIIGLNPQDIYINAGVLLISLKKWRDSNACDKFISFINRYNGDTPYVDQGVINGTLSKKIMRLDLKNNAYTALFDFTYKDLLTFRKPVKYYSEMEVEQAKANPVIVHFTTSFLSLRPWVKGCKHPFVNKWLKYKKMSPWADVPLRNDNRSLKKRIAVEIYKFLPNVLAVAIAGWLHAVLYPKQRKLLKNKWLF